MNTTMKTGMLATLEAGSRFTYGGVEWLVLEGQNSGVLCLAADVLEQRAFDEDNRNDWAVSSLRAYLNEEFLKKLVEDGADKAAFLPLIMDLTSDDGLPDYGKDNATIGLISCEQYRHFRKIIPNASDWWWTCTPFSTERNGYSYNVRIVNSSGALSNGSAYSGYYGVRPLCYLKSDISVSFNTEQATERKATPATEETEDDKRARAADMLAHIAAAFNIPLKTAECNYTPLGELVQQIHKNAVDHGWWEEDRGLPEILMLCVSELSEALEEHRDGHAPDEIYFNENGKPEGVPIEFADCMIRIMDYCGKVNIDIAEAIRIKHEYNKSRPYRHGGKKC